MSSKTAPESWSLTARLTVWYTISVVGLVAVAIGAVHISVKADAEQNINQSVDQSMARIHVNRDLLLRLLETDSDDAHIRIIDPDGRVVHEARQLTQDPLLRSFPSPGERVDIRTGDGRPFSLFTRQLDGWTYQIALNRSDEQEFIARVYRTMAVIAIPALAAAILAGYLITRAGLKPLRQVASAMRSVSAERLDRRVPVESIPRELAEVAGSFNQVMNRLAAAVSRLDQFSGDVAHELRTPVHNLRTAAELALHEDRTDDESRQVLSGVMDEADRLSRLIDRLLVLARLSDPRAALVREETDLAHELSEIRDFYEPVATDSGIGLTVIADAGLIHALDRSLLQRAVSNLVANAMTHTSPGGLIELRATNRSDGIAVAVTDTGRGIPGDAIPHLFDRYYRPHGAVGDGLGLGLAIVKRVMDLHGGSADVVSGVGRGTTVTLTFPLI